jgi:K+-sensing histidine kinase KdpD
MLTPAASPPKHRPSWGYAVTVALVGLATAIGHVTRPHLALPDLVMLYLLVVMVAAARFGRGPSLVAAALSILAFDFFFIPPYFTFTVSEERHILTFAMMFVVGLVISGLTMRIRKQEHRQAELAKEAEAAALRAATEGMRSSLLSAVSHDLRTPLATITGAATTLRDGGAGVAGAQREELLQMICEEADRLERLVTNLLDMTQLASGSLRVRREWTSLEEIVGSALARVEGRLAGRTVRTDLPEDLPLFSGDAVLLEQVLVNLLENAAKYTPPDSAVEIAARADQGGMTVDVADRGPGLPAGEEARIFEKFVRGKQARGPGAGLGLAICRGIVEAHGGTLTAENRAGGGALFRMNLPRVGEPPAPPDREVGVAP